MLNLNLHHRSLNNNVPFQILWNRRNHHTVIRIDETAYSHPGYVKNNSGCTKYDYFHDVTFAGDNRFGVKKSYHRKIFKIIELIAHGGSQLENEKCNRYSRTEGDRFSQEKSFLIEERA